MWFKFRVSARSLIVLCSMLLPQTVFGWGHDGHQLIAETGSRLTLQGRPFWTANATNMGMLTNVPDMFWKSLPTADIEKPTHFFQPDAYVPTPSQFNLIPHDFNQAISKFGRAFVLKNGTATWRAKQFYDLALGALLKKDYKTAVEMAGAMSHYIGDLSQPLHDTTNFDGQATGDPGIHRFFETDNVKVHRAQVAAAIHGVAAQLLKDPKFLKDFKGTVIDVGFGEINRAYPFKDTIIHVDLKQGRGPAGAAKQIELATLRMADGAATLAMVLSHLWAQAGNPNVKVSGAVNPPSWVAPDYSHPRVSCGAGDAPGIDDCAD